MLVPFVAVNLAAYGRALAPYYDTGRPKSETRLPFLESLGVNAVSPGRGVLAYTPLFDPHPLSSCWPSGAVRRWASTTAP